MIQSGDCQMTSPCAASKAPPTFEKMKTHFLKTFFGAAVLPVALAAICLPENSGAQTPPDNAAQPVAPDTLPAAIPPSS